MIDVISLIITKIKIGKEAPPRYHQGALPVTKTGRKDSKIRMPDNNQAEIHASDFEK